jgi:putative acetyltransferase
MSLYPEVQPLRRASREVVRELGFLEPHFDAAGVSHSQCHALIELEHHGRLTSGELATLLNLDPSTMSRTIAQLEESGLITSRSDDLDKRKKPLELTAKGKKKVELIHSSANRQVQETLCLLGTEDRETVVRGMALYAKALARRRAQQQLTLRPIEKQDDPEVARIIRTVMPEFGADGPGFAIHDPEVGSMSESYASPRSGFYVLERNGRLVGCGGFAPLAGGDPEVCEVRKMYFLPEVRGLGMGRRLLLEILEQAKKKKFKRCYLETLKTMAQARRLYESVGFAPRKKPLGSTGHFGCDAWYEREL